MGAVAAIIIKKEKDLVAHFRQARALSFETAQTSTELGIHERFAFSALRDRAVIRDGKPGTYYLDEQSWEASIRQRRRMALIMLVMVVAALAVVALGVKGVQR